ncbi:MAG: hypothetical protein JXA21_20675 [Anaerolineae bacterium]|nr:hypothetical protein [Anaerolineae bacterium]
MKRQATPRRSEKQLPAFVPGLLLTTLLAAIILGLALSERSPEEAALRLERQRAILPYQIASIASNYIIGIFIRVGLVVIGGFGLYYLVRVSVNWLDLRSRQVHARDGVFPLVRLDNGALYDANRASGDNPYITLAALEVQRQAALQADKIIVRQSANNPALPKPEALSTTAEALINLPAVVRLSDVARRPSLECLTLGVTEQGVITAALYDLMHVLAVGASGFGKSAFLRALIWQLAQVPEPVDVVALDVNGSEFNPLRNWNRLLYPVARTTPEAIAALQAVSVEIARRKQLYEGHPTAYDLPSYNAQTTQPLAPMLILTDEGTNLLNQPGIAEPLREVTQTARQYGVYLLLAGQSANHAVIDTQTRDNFSTRLCFHTSPSSYRTVLGQSVQDVTQKGRAWAQITGRTLQQIQCPYVTRDEVQSVLATGGPQRVLDLEVAPLVAANPKERQIEELLDEDDALSDSKIASRVFGYTNARTVEQVKAARRRRQTL